MTDFYNQAIIDDVNRRLDVRRLMQSIDYRFDKYQDNAKTGKGFCPIHREGLFRNLVVDIESRTFKCQYTQCPGSKGGSLVSLYAQALGLGTDVAVRTIVRDQQLDVKLPVNHKWVKAENAAAEAEIAEGKLDEAEARLTEVLDRDPQNPDAHWGLFKIYDARGNQELRSEKLVEVCRLMIAAERATEIPDLIQEWSESDSDSADARFAFAELLVARGDAESAVMEFMGGGDACEGQGELDVALHAYRRAAAISAQNNVDVIDVTPHIIRVLTTSGRANEAIDFLYGQAEAALGTNSLDQAIEFYLLAIEADPAREDSHRRFLSTAAMVLPSPPVSAQVMESVAFLRSQGDHESAIHAMETYLSVAPEDEDAMRSLINDYNNHGRATDAFVLEARLARLIYAHGRTEEAQEIIENVLTWQPQHVPMLEVLVEVQEKEDRGPDAQETRRRLVRALLAQKRFSEAMSALEAPAFDNDSQDALELRASALEGLARGGDETSREHAVAALELLADTHLESTSGRRAVKYLQRALDLLEEPDNQILYKLARAHLRDKNFPAVRDTVITVCENLAGHDRLDEAILEAERYSNLIPDDTDLVRYLVELYLRFDDKPAAVARMRRLAEELGRMGRGDEAEEVLEQANDLEPQNLDSLSHQLDHYRRAGNTERVQQTLLRLAAFHEQAGDFDDAALTLQDYLKDNDTDAVVMSRLVQNLEKIGDESAARHWRLQIARIYRQAGDTDREARVLRDVLVRHPDDEEVLNALMSAEFSRGDMQAGVANARRLVSVYQKAGKSEAARKTLMKAVEHVPENLEINRDIFHYQLNGRQPHQAVSWGKKVINILQASARNADAAEVFEQVAALDPDNLALKQEQLRFLEETGRDAEVAEKRLVLAKIYRDQERFADSETMLEAVLSTDSRNTEARLRLVDLYQHLGETGKAETQLMRIAGTYHLDGESDKAIAVLQQVLAANAAQTDARRQLAQIYRAEGNPEAAVTELLELAAVYRQQQMEIEAVAAERAALELDPDNEDISRRIVDSLKAAGRDNQAADELEKLARNRVAREKHEDALAVCDEILELQPGRLSTRKLRADLWTRMGNPERALQEFQELAEMALSGQAVGVSPAPGQVQQERSALQLVPEYTFDNFVVGANNDFAYATALAIARSPARAYNPLFLYANVGLGKTHLCNAIANHLLEREPNTEIIYTNSEDFTDELVNSIQNNAVQQFRTRYRNLDLLIVDDVQFLAGKERAQEEFFHIFNSLFQAKRQIVITSDRPPSEISHLEARLRSRFGAGVIVDIASPDLETRLAILNREIDENDLNLEAWVPRLLAEKVDTNVRDLKGALNQVIATRDLRRQELTEEGVAQMVGALYPTASV